MAASPETRSELPPRASTLHRLTSYGLYEDRCNGCTLQ